MIASRSLKKSEWDWKEVLEGVLVFHLDGYVATARKRRVMLERFRRMLLERMPFRACSFLP